MDKEELYPKGIGLSEFVKAKRREQGWTQIQLADTTSRIIRLTWEDWQASRAIKKAALAAKGLSAPSRRKTAKREARAALGRILQKNRG